MKAKFYQKEKYFNLLKQAIKDWRFWCKTLIGVTQLTSIIIFLIVASVVEDNIYALPEHLSYFTTLSNLFCAIFFIYSAVFHYQEGLGKFDNSEVAKIAITYITIMILIYNGNQLLSYSPYLFDSWKYYMSLICEHSVVPFLAIMYYLLFYNHQNAKSISDFSKKWLWLMILFLIGYVVFFSIIGFLAKFLGWKQLYGTTDGSNEPSTFVYPFIDWYHGMGFFKSLPAWMECLIILTVVCIVVIAIAYFYTLIVLNVKKSRWQRKVLQLRS